MNNQDGGESCQPYQLNVLRCHVTKGGLSVRFGADGYDADLPCYHCGRKAGRVTIMVAAVRGGFRVAAVLVDAAEGHSTLM